MWTWLRDRRRLGIIVREHWQACDLPGGPGRPPLPTRLMAGLAILKHTFNLSDEELARRWVQNPYFAYFCGEEHFLQIPVHRGQSFRRIADSVPVIADSL